MLSKEATSDELSIGRVRRLPITDAEEVIRAFQGENSVAKHRPKSPFLKVSPVPLICLIIFCIFYMSPIYSENPCAHTCLAILILGGVLWGTETVPSYVTAYLIPILCVWFKVGYDPETGERISAGKLATIICAKFTDPIIFVFLGTLVLSAALAKLNITEMVSRIILSRISTKPRIVLLTIMLLNFGISAFLTNIASTTIFLTFTLPIIRELHPEDPFVKALLFGLAWSGNCGGVPTPIASAHNILAIKFFNEKGTNVSFIEWVAFGGPIGFICCVCFWIYLCLIFKPNHENLIFQVKNDTNLKWTHIHTLSCCVTVVTIAMMAMQETFPAFLGHIGITALIPVVFFHGTGIMTTEDFGNLRWSTLSLMGGGLALGEAMKVSGLITLLSESITHLVGDMDVFLVVFILLLIESVLVSVINHTSAAAILFPVLSEIGNHYNEPGLFLCLSAVMIGEAQLFHISSFSTALVSSVQIHDAKNHMILLPEPAIPGPQFFTYGWPIVLMSVIIIGTIGYVIVKYLEIGALPK